MLLSKFISLTLSKALDLSGLSSPSSFTEEALTESLLCARHRARPRREEGERVGAGLARSALGASGPGAHFIPAVLRTLLVWALGVQAERGGFRSQHGAERSRLVGACFWSSRCSWCCEARNGGESNAGEDLSTHEPRNAGRVTPWALRSSAERPGRWVLPRHL